MRPYAKTIIQLLDTITGLIDAAARWHGEPAAEVATIRRVRMSMDRRDG